MVLDCDLAALASNVIGLLGLRDPRFNLLYIKQRSIEISVNVTVRALGYGQKMGVCSYVSNQIRTSRDLSHLRTRISRDFNEAVGWKRPR